MGVAGWPLQAYGIWFYGEQLPENLIPEEEKLEEIQNEAEEDMEIASSDEEDSSDEND